METVKNKKKVIAIVGHPISGGFGIGSAYLDFFSRFGDVTIITHTETEVKEVDLLVLPGGPDVDTSRYLGEDSLSLKTGNPCIFRERFDRVLLPKYISAGVPIIGICRGHQSLAVHFGGELVQHMSHENNDSDRQKKVHKIDIDITAIKELGFTEKVIDVNSIHHQVVSYFKLPEFAKVIARHVKDREIEAISYYPYYPAYTFQYHPEEIHDTLSIAAIHYLLNNH